MVDFRVRIASSGTVAGKVGTFRDVRLVPGFGANLVSGPRLEGEGYALHQENGVYTARKNGDLVFQALKDERGLYFLSVEYLPSNPSC